MLIFFFKQKTAYEMRISDWSSDVCSSDLRGERRHGLGQARHQPAAEGAKFAILDDQPELDRIEPQPPEKIRRAQLFGAKHRLTISDQKVRKRRVGQHRHMTEYVVKHIGLFAVGDLLGEAEEIGGGKMTDRSEEKKS